MDWWAWIVGGLVLCLMELLTPGVFYVLFFGLGAIVVGILTWIGLIETDWVQILLLSVLSVSALALFRRTLLDKLTREELDGHVTTIKDDVGIALGDIPPDGRGQVEMRGTGWSAHNKGDTLIVKGQKCIIEQVEGVVLYIKGK